MAKVAFFVYCSRDHDLWVSRSNMLVCLRSQDFFKIRAYWLSVLKISCKYMHFWHVCAYLNIGTHDPVVLLGRFCQLGSQYSAHCLIINISIE